MKKTGKILFATLAVSAAICAFPANANRFLVSPADSSVQTACCGSAASYLPGFLPVRIFYSTDEADYAPLLHALKNRNGRLIIEILQGVMLDSDGNGVDACGYYIHYSPDRFSENDRIQSILIYNPCTNAPDDILCRIDIRIR